MQPKDDPIVHYEQVTAAWRYLLGDNFHYGYFRTEDEPLEVATENLTRLMAEKGSIGSGMTVLDVGCGIGNPAFILARRYGCRVTGISTSRTGVKHARGRAQEQGCSNQVKFIVADGMDNRLPDDSFDCVWVLESSHLMPRKDALLAECARVVRCKGCVVLCDVILHHDLSLYEVLRHARQFTHLRYAFGRAKMETLETYQRNAEKVGLEVTALEDISDQTFPTFAHWHSKLENSREQVRALIGDDGFRHFEASCKALPGFWKQRILGYGLMAAMKR